MGKKGGKARADNLDIFLVHAGKFGGHFEGILGFRHIDCWRALILGEGEP